MSDKPRYRLHCKFLPFIPRLGTTILSWRVGDAGPWFSNCARAVGNAGKYPVTVTASGQDVEFLLKTVNAPLALKYPSMELVESVLGSVFSAPSATEGK